MRLLPLLLVMVVATACTPDEIALSYGVEPGTKREFRLTLEAEISRTLAGDPRREVVEAVFVAGQEIRERLPGGGARAVMSLVPQSLRVDGRAVRVGAAQQFVVQLAADGRLVAIERDSDSGGQAEPLEPVGIDRLLPRLRPVLPESPVSLGDTWRSQSSFEDEAGRFSITLDSRLAELAVLDGRPSALVRTHYASPVARREVFANAVADIRGEDVGAQEAWFSLDGVLLRATGDSVGRYRVTFRPPADRTGPAPVAASLDVRLHTEIELLR